MSMDQRCRGAVRRDTFYLLCGGDGAYDRGARELSGQYVWKSDHVDLYCADHPDRSRGHCGSHSVWRDDKQLYLWNTGLRRDRISFGMHHTLGGGNDNRLIVL